MQRIHLLPIGLALYLLGCTTAKEYNPPAPDLSTPETTVVSFTEAAAQGDVEAAMSCVHPEGVDYEDLRRLLAPGADNPFKQLIEARDPDVPIEVVSMSIKGETATVVWRIALARDVHVQEGPGHTFPAGTTYDLDGTLKKSDDRWLIDGI